MNPHHLYGHLRHDELLAEAAQLRPARSFRRRRALRLYARLWWASRPRVETWPRALLEP
ncbi:hypothetical protein [Pseudonocardia abyssalis]|uniref:Uncharacterized protein n=1 Tax=Pseudonocardia abyssalis TaxID=2792008 RepID=A0ABS6UUJ6_9PSEU|nr:hypothetical protein [Pseudonocardia abyssalis]MBW0117734.1 hypothetical protein [Pseudonocardia abyssalis]MBW0135931.1 hypothetical protein [Pseudonocardia abyssalis]